MSVDKFGRYSKQSKIIPSNINLTLNAYGDYDVQNRKIVNMSAPDDNNDAVTKTYVDELIHIIESKVFQTMLCLKNDAFDANLKRIRNLKAPKESRDVVNKSYADFHHQVLKTELVKTAQELEKNFIKQMSDKQDTNNINFNNLSNQIQSIIQTMPVMIESKCRMLIANELKLQADSGLSLDKNEQSAGSTRASQTGKTELSSQKGDN